MILVQVQNVRKQFGPEPVLDGVSFDIRRGDRLGLVGPNGTGKSTLLRILAGQLDADAGDTTVHATARLGYLEQHPQFPPQVTVQQVAEAGLAALKALVRQTEQAAQELAEAADDATRRRCAQRYDRLQHAVQEHDAYHLEHRVERILDGLGFARTQYEQTAASLSGGQQNRLLLAQLLLSEPEVMLLDEPSNHLDLAATQWLEDHLTGSRQAYLLVSHDRYFLDKVTTRTLELFRGTVDDYRGNFSAYWRQKQERLEVEKRTFARQQEEISRLEDFVRRHRYGQKHAQAKDRERKLERIEPVAPPREISVPPMGFPAASRSGDVVLRVVQAAKSYAEPLFQELTFTIQRGERWGILGGNGTGKSTLLKSIMGQVPLDRGQIHLGSGVRIGYYDQKLESVDAHLEAVEAVRPAGKEFVEQQRRDLLARFGLTGDMVFQPVVSLSGGERSRVALARLAAEDPNFLILDEPTNHLDLWACDALEKSLREFQGSALLVSHDRYFLNRVVDRLLVVESGGYRIVEGNYDMYLHLVRSGLAGPAAAAPPSAPEVASDTPPAPAKRAANRSRRKRQFPFRPVVDIEAEIEQLETEIQKCQLQLADPFVLRDGRRIQEVQSSLAAFQEQLATLYAHWEEAHELNG